MTQKKGRRKSSLPSSSTGTTKKETANNRQKGGENLPKSGGRYSKVSEDARDKTLHTFLQNGRGRRNGKGERKKRLQV